MTGLKQDFKSINPGILLRLSAHLVSGCGYLFCFECTHFCLSKSPNR